MSNSDQNKPGGKSGKRKQKRSQKPDQAQTPMPDQQQAAKELIDAAIASADTSPADEVVAADTSPVGLQTIATAYRDCTRKSLEDARSYVEKLSGARSIDKAVEVQTEFAKQAYETFVADSWKIRGLYSELFKQMLKLPGGPSR